MKRIKCSCGYKERVWQRHIEGSHHKKGKPVKAVIRGIKTNVGDPSK